MSDQCSRAFLNNLNASPMVSTNKGDTAESLGQSDSHSLGKMHCVIPSSDMALMYLSKFAMDKISPVKPTSPKMVNCLGNGREKCDDQMEKQMAKSLSGK